MAFVILCFCGFTCVFAQNNELNELNKKYNEYYEKGQYQEALEIATKYINKFDRSGIKKNPNYLDALMVQAWCILILDNNIHAFNSISQKFLVSKYEKGIDSGNDKEFIKSINEGFLFFLCRNMNDFNEINTCLELLSERRLEIVSSRNGEKNLANLVAKIYEYKKNIYSLYDQSVAYYLEEKYELSYMVACKLKSLLEDISLVNNSMYAECLQLVGISSLMWNSDYEEFKNCIESAISLEKQLKGLKYYWYLQCYADGMTEYSKKVDSPDNISLLKSAISIYETLPKQYSYGLQEALANLSVHYSNINIEESINLGEKALALQRQSENPDTIISYSNLCEYYIEVGELDKALEYGTKVLNYRKKTSDSNGLRIIYKRLAKVFARKKDFEMAINYAKKSLNLSRRVSPMISAEILNNIGTYYIAINKDKEAIKYLVQSYKCEKSKSNTYNLAGLYARLNNLDSCRYYSVENRNIIIDKFLQTYETLDEEDKYNYLHSETTYHLLYATVETCVVWDNDGLANLAFDCILQNKILLNSVSCREKISAKLSSANCAKIKSQLKEGEIAIEMWSNKDFNFGPSGYIYVFAIKRDWRTPKVIKLSKNDIYRALNNEIQTSENYLPMFETIWKPILSQIGVAEGDTIYMSLDDILSQIPVENICGYDWKYMGDKYNIRRVSDTSKIHELREFQPFTSAYLYGGAINSFEYLPWSDIEIDNASVALGKLIFPEKISIRKGNLCTKKSVTQLSGNAPSILHFATHGFNISSKENDNIFSGYDKHIFAMDHMGLIFSNTDTGNEDCLLSASEISKLDLSKTDLVVISSCNSGIGDFSAVNIDAELIYAFKRAGVHTIMVSLSEIDDVATSVFMKVFYEKLSAGLSKNEAFKLAQKTLRKSEEFSKFPYWAYFVMID